ncbi:gamma carbonic anhydrase family protein [Paludibacterium yongneupense]|uniref:gamma carbonic anhydrase family protein n=1 Tax=Paludibacterium yongneupense TaxID=400061 RepID=UPI0003FD7913|nr:gamma carbonic anhydrase family protein [Paludibacterium yongneupense]
MKRNIRSYLGQRPVIEEGGFIDPCATVIGEVHLARKVSVWPGAIIRGDVNRIEIGEGSNVQDGSMLHVTHKRSDDPEGAPLVIGRNVTIGHNVTLHGCTLGDEVLVGIGSIVLDRAVVGSRVLIGAGSLVPPGKRLESGYLYLGNPVKQVRALTERELAFFEYSALHYQRLADNHQQSLAADEAENSL